MFALFRIRLAPLRRVTEDYSEQTKADPAITLNIFLTLISFWMGYYLTAFSIIAKYIRV